MPVQSFWYLGGPGTLRGYGGNAASGDAFWRARLELANRWPAAHALLFADVARAVRSPIGWRLDFYTDAAL